MNIRITIVLVSLALATALFAKPNPAYQLACIDAGKRISEADKRISKYQKAIDILEERYGLTETEIGDKTYFVVNKLKKKKIKTSVLEMLEAMVKLKEAKELGMSYDETIVTLSMTMEGDKNRK